MKDSIAPIGKRGNDFRYKSVTGNRWFRMDRRTARLFNGRKNRFGRQKPLIESIEIDSLITCLREHRRRKTWLPARNVSTRKTSRRRVALCKIRWDCCQFMKVVLFSFALSGLALCAAAQQAPILFQHVRVFDGKTIIPETDVFVEGGLIRDVGQDLNEASAQIVDGTGKTLLPGLIDSHTHVWGAEALQQALVFGITTELDMFMPVQVDAELKKLEATGRGQNMADLRSAGTLATVPGGHGTEYGVKIPTITDPADAQAWVDARIAEGSDYIKIIYDDARVYGGQAVPTLSKSTMAAIIAAAHRRGKIAVVHIGSLQGARDAIEAGADGLAHLFIGPTSDLDFGQFVAAHHAFVIATLTVLHSICGPAAPGLRLISDPHLQPFLSPMDITALKRSFPQSTRGLSCKGATEAVKQLEAAGVPILAGTDVPNPGTVQGASLHEELQYLVEAGLTPTEALTAATSAPATAFHLDDRGRIAKGLRADLVLVNGDPSEDILATRDIVAVYKQGIKDDRDSYLAMVTRQKEQEKRLASSAAPAGSESGLVSDFEQNTPTAKFGSGWSISTDTMAGGKSTAAMKIVPGGANGSGHALEVSGTIAPGLPYAWAGVMFSPGNAPMEPVNLSSKKTISFWAKGDGKTYRIMLFAQSHGFVPAVQNFSAPAEWKHYSLPLSSFEGMDGHDLMGLLFAGGPRPGPFRFEIDDVRFE